MMSRVYHVYVINSIRKIHSNITFTLYVFVQNIQETPRRFLPPPISARRPERVYRYTINGRYQARSARRYTATAQYHIIIRKIHRHAIIRSTTTRPPQIRRATLRHNIRKTSRRHRGSVPGILYRSRRYALRRAPVRHNTIHHRSAPAPG